VLHVALLVAPADVERAEGLAQKAKKHCLVSAALKTPVDLELTVGAAEPATV
jgi:organic hydroperoxide reductase OsmC/OhrA